MGKYTEEYSGTLKKQLKERMLSEVVLITLLQVSYMFENYHNDTDSPFIKITCEIIAYAIGAHHGLFDC